MPTAEEQGLIGSKYYVDNPIYPLENTIGIMNMDLLNVFGRTNDISFYGDVHQLFEEPLQKALKLQNRVLIPDPNPSNGMFYRSDHLPFVLKGVPGLFINMGFDPSDSGVPRDSIFKKNALWTVHCYHKTFDRMFTEDFYFSDAEGISMKWDLSGACIDVDLIFQIGLSLIS